MCESELSNNKSSDESCDNNIVWFDDNNLKKVTITIIILIC